MKSSKFDLKKYLNLFAEEIMYTNPFESNMTYVKNMGKKLGWTNDIECKDVCKLACKIECKAKCKEGCKGGDILVCKIKCKKECKEGWRKNYAENYKKKFVENYEFTEYCVKYENYKKKNKPFSKEKFMGILLDKKLDYYYDYYVYLDIVSFVFEESSKSSLKKKIIIDKVTFKLTEDSVTYLKLLSICLFFDSLDIDNFKQNRIYNKRMINKLILICEDISNTNINFSEERSELSQENMLEFNKELSDILSKYIICANKLLIETGFSKGYISYSHKHMSTRGEKFKRIEEREDNNVSLISIIEDTQSEELIHLKNSDSDSIDLLITSTEEYQHRYNNQGVRFSIISKQILFKRNIIHTLYYTPPQIVNFKLKFSDTLGLFDIFTYNVANPHKYSKFIFNLNLIQKISTTPINFSLDLYNTIEVLFLDKFKKREDIPNINKYFAIEEIFSNLFKSGEKNIKLFFPYIVDFRGRIYINHPLSITDIKFLRYIMSPVKELSENFNMKRNTYYWKIYNYNYLLKKLNYKLIYTSDDDCVMLLIGLLSLGKIQKSKLLVDCKVSIESFIKRGIEIMNEKNDKTCLEKFQVSDADDMAAILTQRKKIYNFIINREYFSILADSTASGIFHLNLWLKMNIKYIDFINIKDSDYWFDTYSCIFHYITKKIMEDTFPDDLWYLFTRARLKGVYMKYPYNASNLTIRNNICDKNMTPAELILIKPHMKKFIKALEETFDDLFVTSFHKLKKLPYFNDKNVFELNNNTFDFAYYNLTEKEKRFAVRGLELSTYLKTVVLDDLGNPKINNDKTETAWHANVMHCSDSTFLYMVYMKCTKKNIFIKTIHDEFIVPVYNYTEFIEICNIIYAEMYNEINNENIICNSFFIVL